MIGAQISHLLDEWRDISLALDVDLGQVVVLKGVGIKLVHIDSLNGDEGGDDDGGEVEESHFVVGV